MISTIKELYTKWPISISHCYRTILHFLSGFCISVYMTSQKVIFLLRVSIQIKKFTYRISIHLRIFASILRQNLGIRLQSFVSGFQNMG